MTKRAIVAFSGGQDSTTCLGATVVLYGPENVLALTADYGQRHLREIEAAKRIAEFFGVEHEVVNLAGVLQGSSPLTDPNEPLETYSSYAEMEKIIGNRRELTFVPMRNMLFLTVAANRAVVNKAEEIWTGVCQEDNANYSDCRQVFIDTFDIAMNTSLGLAPDDQYAIDVVTPLMNLTKAETVKLAAQDKDTFYALSMSHTAYSGEYPPITQDHATVLRAQGFLDAGVPDPLILRAWHEDLIPLPPTSNYNDMPAKHLPFNRLVELVRLRVQDGI